MLVNLGCSTTLSSATSPGSRHVTALLGVGCLYACGMLGLAFAGLGTAYLMAMNAACCVGGVAVQTLMQRMRHKRDASDWAACTVIASVRPCSSLPTSPMMPHPVHQCHRRTHTHRQYQLPMACTWRVGWRP